MYIIFLFAPSLVKLPNITKICLFINRMILIVNRAFKIFSISMMVECLFIKIICFCVYFVCSIYLISSQLILNSFSTVMKYYWIECFTNILFCYCVENFLEWLRINLFINVFLFISVLCFSQLLHLNWIDSRTSVNRTLINRGLC